MGFNRLTNTQYNIGIDYAKGQDKSIINEQVQLQQNQRNPGQEYIGIFAGLTLTSQGDRINQKTQQQEHWMKFKLNFLQQTQYGPKNTNFTMFAPVSQKSLDPTTLSIGKEYKIFYNIKPYQHPQYGTVNAKKAYMILEFNSKPVLNQSSPQYQKPIPTQPIRQSTLNTPKNEEEYAYDIHQGQEYTQKQASFVHSKPTFTTPSELELWNNSQFNNLEEWLNIAEKSDVFQTEERAIQVFNILSKVYKVETYEEFLKRKYK